MPELCRYLWSDSKKAASILDRPLTVGVEHIYIFLLKNVLVLAIANSVGSPSVPAEASYLSTSSNNKTLIGLEAKPKAELEVSELEAELIPAELVQSTWIDYVANVRAKLLGLPSRIAHQVITVDKYAEAEIIIKEKVYEALDELVNEGIPAKYRKSIFTKCLTHLQSRLDPSPMMIVQPTLQAMVFKIISVLPTCEDDITTIL